MFDHSINDLRTRRRRILLLIAGAAIVAAGCSSSASNETSTPTTPNEKCAATRTNTETTASRFKVPVPSGAQLNEKLSDDTMSSYCLPSMTPTEAAAFYDDRMPTGKSWNGLEWCELAPTPNGDWRTWQESGTDNFLVVTVGPDAPAWVQIWDDKNDPSPCDGS